MTKVAIVIPLYKSDISVSETTSLKRVVKILHNYSIYFVGPQSLNIQNHQNIVPDGTYIPFDQKFFKNISGYSQLMMNKSFYQKFLDYHYILIYQLDAFIFRDELDYWCLKGYDYVGAPWITTPPLQNGNPIINMQKLFVKKVGNGGFSLRKVSIFYKITNQLSFFIRLFNKNEDMFWGVIIDYLPIRFKKPEWREALSFAFELNPKKSFEINDNQLPMGVHAWEKYDPEFWKDKMT